MLSIEEKEQLRILRELQKRTNRFLSQKEFDTIVSLSSKEYDHCCTNPSCTGGRFEDKETCPKCGYLLHIHHQTKRKPHTFRKEDMGDELCKYCPLEKKGVYGVDGGYIAGCEGSRCNDAYDNYLESVDGCSLNSNHPLGLPDQKLTIEDVLAYLKGLTRYYVSLSYEEDLEQDIIGDEPDEDGDWIKYEDIEALINRLKS